MVRNPFFSAICRLVICLPGFAVAGAPEGQCKVATDRLNSSSESREKEGLMPRAKFRADRRVDDYINSLPSWQQKVCREVRDLVHAADAQVNETIKRIKLPNFTLDGNICALMGTKDHVNIFVYDPIAPDPEGIINQGHNNSSARAIQVREGESLK